MLYTCCGPQANQTSNQERPEVSDSQEETTSTVALPPAEPMGLSPEYPANEPPMPAPELPLSPEEEIPEEEIYQTEEEEDPFLYKETA